jgi:hypothetical protein
VSALTENIGDIVGTLAHILRERGQQPLANILRNASIDIRETSYDNWNGGTYGYTLDLQVPVNLYAEIQDNLEKVEKDLLSQLTPLLRTYENEFLENVIIAPKLLRSSPDANQNASEEDIQIEQIRFWRPSYFRLFLSHTAKHKLEASQIQKTMLKYAVSVFVAHEDIEPTKEWQNEIELALSSMDALAALLTEGYCESKWCDQELGVAIGRKTLVIPIRSGIDPYGFIGKYQGVAGLNRKVEDLCASIFDILGKHDTTKTRITSALVSKLCNAESFVESKTTVGLLSNLKENLTQKMAEKLRAAAETNGQINHSFGVVDRIKELTKAVL